MHIERIDRWKLAEELTCNQIALLLAGYDPSEFERDPPDNWHETVKQDISPYLSAIRNAARSGKLKSTLVKYDSAYGGAAEIDWSNSTIEVAELCEWMRRRNFQDEFFLSDGNTDKWAERSSPFYAPKLAAAVRAWTEVTADPKAGHAKSPKAALKVWLRKHANEYGLTGKDGGPNNLGIEEICKVANWKLAGGATPTPQNLGPPGPVPVPEGRKVKPRPPSPPRKITRSAAGSELSDDDIPF